MSVPSCHTFKSPEIFVALKKEEKDRAKELAKQKIELDKQNAEQALKNKEERELKCRRQNHLDNHHSGHENSHRQSHLKNYAHRYINVDSNCRVHCLDLNYRVT